MKNKELTPLEIELKSTVKYLMENDIKEFQKQHQIEVILGSDLQYMCYIDNNICGQGFTKEGALVYGIKKYKEKEAKIFSIGVRNKLNEIEIILKLLAKHCASNTTEEIELKDALMGVMKKIRLILKTKY